MSWPSGQRLRRALGATVRSECLDWLLIANRRHLGRVLRTYVEHYNGQRPHRSLQLLAPLGTSAAEVDRACRTLRRARRADPRVPPGRPEPRRSRPFLPKRPTGRTGWVRLRRPGQSRVGDPSNLPPLTRAHAWPTTLNVTVSCTTAAIEFVHPSGPIPRKLGIDRPAMRARERRESHRLGMEPWSGCACRMVSRSRQARGLEGHLRHQARSLWLGHG